MYTQDQLDTLRAALAAGTLRVTHGDSTVEYRSQADLERAIAIVEQSLAADAGLAPIRRVRVIGTKGL